MSKGHILVIDDEEDFLVLVRQLLERAGYRMTAAADGTDGLRAFYAAPPDLVLLDVAMPGLDGWQVLERIRSFSDVPVLMLTARKAELEKVRGLKAGADDYVGKPFGRQELLARIEALLRRARGPSQIELGYQDDRLAIDFPQRRVLLEGREVSLTPLEFKLLATFVRHPNQVLGHEQLLKLVWDDSYGVAPDEVRTYVSYLRRKLGTDHSTSPIETVRGFGYRYRPPSAGPS